MNLYSIMLVDDEVYGRVEIDDLHDILQKYRDQ